MINLAEGRTLVELLGGEVPAPLDFVIDGLRAYRLHRLHILFFAGPILVPALEQAKQVPPWLRRAIRVERLKLILAELRVGTVGRLATLAEVSAYLAGADLDDGQAALYSYAAGRIKNRYRRNETGTTPRWCRLNSAEHEDLQQLRKKIRRGVVWRARQTEMAAPGWPRYTQTIPEGINYDHYAIF